MKKKMNNSCQVAKQKERHIVSWSQEEDDILREQIRIHGTENWGIIASKFKDKTTRQCRRRWFTYLNSDFKKGGWSPEEDMLLCEAQKVYGNRWTEIAKVVSGRTDNAVKNRFTTLCKKRAKREALAKENNTSYINLNNKRVFFSNLPGTDGGSECTEPSKKIRRTYIANPTELLNKRENLVGECGIISHLLRPPFSVLAQNIHDSVDKLPSELHVYDLKDGVPGKPTNGKPQETFLKKDDPKILALTQQAELLSSQATKVNSENTVQSLENAWNVLQNYLKQNKETNMLTCRVSDADLQFENVKELIEDLRSNESNTSPWRQPDLYESSDSSEYGTQSTLLSHAVRKSEECQHEICTLHKEATFESQTNQLSDKHVGDENGNCSGTASRNEADSLLAYGELKAANGAVYEYSTTEFSSPLQVTPLFRSLTTAVPSPQFTESEKHFLMKTLGMESASPCPSNNPSQNPVCKRSLLHCL